MWYSFTILIMRKILLFLLPVLLAFIVFIIFSIFFLKQSNGKGALQVTSLPRDTTVYVDGRLLGKTPLCKCDSTDMLPVGDYTIKLVPSDSSLSSYEDRITINPSVLTVVDRTFGDIGKSSGSVITLNKINESNLAQLFVTSFPYGADVSIDNNSVGSTPQLVTSITNSDHDLLVSKDGYKSKTIRIHGVLGYKLNALIYLATDLTAASSSATTQSAPIASPSASLQPTVTILSTPTGFLRVRDAASLGGNEIAQVHPGETYPLVSQTSGWFQIKLSDGKLGWVSSSYAQTNKF